MRWRRVLNKHYFGSIVISTNPRLQNIIQNVQILCRVDFKSSLDEMRSHHPSITCHSCKNHQRSRIFALRHRTNIWWITGNNLRILAVGNLVHNELFLINKNVNMSSFVLDMIEKLWSSFNPDGSWAGSEEVAASLNVRAHPKVFIDCSADGSVANIAFFWPVLILTELGQLLSTFSILPEKFWFAFDHCEGCGNFVELYPRYSTWPGLHKLLSLYSQCS